MMVLFRCVADQKNLRKCHAKVMWDPHPLLLAAASVQLLSVPPGGCTLKWGAYVYINVPIIITVIMIGATYVCMYVCTYVCMYVGM